MLYLAGSIVLTSWLTLCFKVVERFKLDNLQVIVSNYITCVITGSVINGSAPLTRSTVEAPWFPWALVMGTMFVALFNVVAITTQRFGVSVSSVAYKLSLVVPFLFSIYLYNEDNTTLKTIGVILALIAVALTCYKPATSTGVSHGLLFWILPAVLFLGSGLLDTMIKYVEQRFLDGSNNNEYLISAFLMAAVSGIVMLLIVLVTKRRGLSWKAILMGISVGIPNYLSIWCLMKVLQQFSTNSSAIIPINNMGIVLFSSIVAFLFFREKLSALNWSGIVLAVVAIALIAYG